MFMPQRPYLPLGTMRAAITYPDPPDAFETAEVAAVVKRVGLAEFLPTLDFETRLDKNFSLGQQQLLAFARLLLHRPAWVFLDEATSALDEVSQRRVMSIFDHELANADGGQHRPPPRARALPHPRADADPHAQGRHARPHAAAAAQAPLLALHAPRRAGRRPRRQP